MRRAAKARSGAGAWPSGRAGQGVGGAAGGAAPAAASAARFPRVTTRGAYDRATGEPLAPTAAGAGAYRLYPKAYFDGLAGAGEIAVMVHGLRNASPDASRKFVIARDRLRELGYGHPVVGYSYDSNTRGAGTAGAAGARAAAVGVRIAEQNGTALAAFVARMRSASRAVRVRLLGHSLGSQVILSAVGELARARPRAGGQVESIHLFGASVPASAPSVRSAHGPLLQRVVRSSIVSHYAPTDEVLLEAAAAAGGGARGGGRPGPGDPLGLYGSHGRAVAKYAQVEVAPASHRFASYAAVLERFP